MKSPPKLWMALFTAASLSATSYLCVPALAHPGARNTGGSTQPKAGGQKGPAKDQPEAGARDVKVVEGALEITLSDEQKTAVKSAASSRNDAMKTARETFRSALTAIHKSSATSTEKEAAVLAASGALNAAFGAAQDGFFNAVATAVEQPVGEVATKIKEYLAQGKGKGKGPGQGRPGRGPGKSGGTCNKGGSGGNTGGGSTGGGGTGGYN